jgi:hypothetical protein
MKKTDYYEICNQKLKYLNYFFQINFFLVYLLSNGKKETFNFNYPW